MSMSVFHITFSLELIALALGAAVLIWSKVHKDAGTIIPKILGSLIILLALATIVCTVYCAFEDCKNVKFNLVSSFQAKQQEGKQNMRDQMAEKVDAQPPSEQPVDAAAIQTTSLKTQ